MRVQHRSEHALGSPQREAEGVLLLTPFTLCLPHGRQRCGRSPTRWVAFLMGVKHISLYIKIPWELERSATVSCPGMGTCLREFSE